MLSGKMNIQILLVPCAVATLFNVVLKMKFLDQNLQVDQAKILDIRKTQQTDITENISCRYIW